MSGIKSSNQSISKIRLFEYGLIILLNPPRIAYKDVSDYFFFLYPRVKDGFRYGSSYQIIKIKAV